MNPPPCTASTLAVYARSEPKYAHAMRPNLGPKRAEICARSELPPSYKASHRLGNFLPQNGCGANGCEHQNGVQRTRLNPQTPKVSNENPSLRFRENKKKIQLGIGSAKNNLNSPNIKLVPVGKTIEINDQGSKREMPMQVQNG